MKFDFGCFGEPSKEVAFATFLDTFEDEIPTDVNLGVFLASGLPFDEIKDFEFPFIVNDSEYWRIESKFPGLFSSQTQPIVLQAGTSGGNMKKLVEISIVLSLKKWSQPFVNRNSFIQALISFLKRIQLTLFNSLNIHI